MTSVCQSRKGTFLAVGFAFSLLLVEFVESASLYWTDERGIHRSDLDGQNHQTIVPIEITSILDMTIDEADEKIYYADFYGKRILRSNLDGTHLEDVITSGVWHPTSVAVDSIRRKIYWIAQSQIFRANLDGTDIEVIVDSWEISHLALDEKAEKIYWFAFFPHNPPMMLQANLDGGDRKPVVVWDNEDPHDDNYIYPKAYTLDTDRQKVYFIHDRKIQRVNTNGANIEVVVELDKVDHFMCIAFDERNRRIFWTDPKTGRLYRSNHNGRDVETIVQQDKIGEIALHSADNKIYWANGLEDTIVHRANVDGSEHEVVLEPPTQQFFGIDLDQSKGQIYWASANRWQAGERREILRANLDGTAVESIIATGIGRPTGIAVDERGEKIYWVESHRKILRANLDGSNPEDLDIDGIGVVPDIEVDVESGKLYWIDRIHGLHRGNLNGTNVEVLIGNLDSIYGIGVVPFGETVYWTEVEGPHDTIRVVNLNNGNLETLIKRERSGWWHDLDLDNTNQKIYWVNQRKGLIQRANLDGSEVEMVVSGLATPKYLALYLPTEDVVTVKPEGETFVFWGGIRQSRLLQNYPNPFNPETWIPYQLAETAEIALKIYDTNGLVVRELLIGHQPVGMYQSRSRAAYWDGRNQHGEAVATGIYFCTLTAGDFAATRKMLVNK